jgi:hypothetical protein
MPLHPPLKLSDLCEDVILLICSHLRFMQTEDSITLKNLSLTSRQFRLILSPLLFKTLHINKPISQLPAPPKEAQHARTFNVDMFGSLWWWCSGSYTSSTDAVATLELSMMSRSVDIFIAAFTSPLESNHAIFTLPNITSLVVTSSAAFLVNYCPNLRKMTIQDGGDCLLETYNDLSKRLSPLCLGPQISKPSLTSFDATATWSTSELSSLIESFPKLQHLRMRSDTYCYRASTASIIEILATGLEDLTTLHLVKSGNLGMGYQSIWKRRIQSCSNAEYRQMLWRENERLRVEVENNVAREAFGKIGSLRECWVGEKRVARRLVEEHDGVKWLWERTKENDDRGEESFGLEKFRLEKENVVVQSEIGF